MFKGIKILFIFCVVLMGTTTISANSYPGKCSGTWMAKAEYLYLLANVGDTYFVIQSSFSTVSTGFPQGSKLNLGFGFQSGFRVGLGYQFGPCRPSVELSYARL